MSRRNKQRRSAPADPGAPAPAESAPDAINVEAEASVPGVESEAPTEGGAENAPEAAQEGPENAPEESEASDIADDETASPGAAPAEAETGDPEETSSPDPGAPAPAESAPEPAEPFVVVRFTGRGPWVGRLGGEKVRQRVFGGTTISIPERCLDEARQKGFEFVRHARV